MALREAFTWLGNKQSCPWNTFYSIMKIGWRKKRKGIADRKKSSYEGSEGGEDHELSQEAIQERELRTVSFSSSQEQVPFQQRTSLPWGKMDERKPLPFSSSLLRLPSPQ